MGEKTIYQLELHEHLQISPELIIVRVAGGWNYTYYVCNKGAGVCYDNWVLQQVVFVPFNNEFQI